MEKANRCQTGRQKKNKADKDIQSLGKNSWVSTQTHCKHMKLYVIAKFSMLPFFPSIV